MASFGKELCVADMREKMYKVAWKAGSIATSQFENSQFNQNIVLTEDE